MLFRTLAAAATVLAMTACSSSAPPPVAPCPSCAAPTRAPAAFVLTESKHDFRTTVTRLEQAIVAKGLKVMARIDHQANASSVGLELAPTLVLVFGNPMVGTKLMQDSRTIGLDLPLRILVWERPDHSVQLVFRDAASMAQAHAISPESELVAKVQGALMALVDSAAH